MSATIEVLVATMNESEPLALASRMGLLDAGVDVLIINQCTTMPTAPAFAQGRVRMLSFAERGLSRSRNRALQHARGDLLMLADNDICYRAGFADLVRDAYAREPSADVITLQFVNGVTGELGRSYPAAARWHSSLSLGSIRSIEISLRRAAATAQRFDTRFGLGAPLPQGEEAIFLLDLLRAGKRLRFEPVITCEHPGHTSGHQLWDLAMLHTKGAVLRRAYPELWPVLCAWFTLTKRARHSPTLSAPRFGRALFEGARLGLRNTPRK